MLEGLDDQRWNTDWLLQQVFKQPTSISMDHCNNCTCDCLFLLVKSKKKESSECSVYLDCSEIAITSMFNINAESHQSLNEVVSERLASLYF